MFRTFVFNVIILFVAIFVISLLFKVGGRTQSSGICPLISKVGVDEETTWADIDRGELNFYCQDFYGGGGSVMVENERYCWKLLDGDARMYFTGRAYNDSPRSISIFMDQRFRVGDILAHINEPEIIRSRDYSRSSTIYLKSNVTIWARRDVSRNRYGMYDRVSSVYFNDLQAYSDFYSDTCK